MNRSFEILSVGVLLGLQLLTVGCRSIPIDVQIRCAEETQDFIDRKLQEFGGLPAEACRQAKAEVDSILEEYRHVCSQAIPTTKEVEDVIDRVCESIIGMSPEKPCETEKRNRDACLVSGVPNCFEEIRAYQACLSKHRGIRRNDAVQLFDSQDSGDSGISDAEGEPL